MRGYADVSPRPGAGPAPARPAPLIRRLSRPLISLLLGLMLVPLSATSGQAAGNAVDSASYGASVSLSLLGLPLTLAKLPVSEFPAGPTSNTTLSVNVPGLLSLGALSTNANGDQLADTATADNSVAGLSLTLLGATIGASGLLGSSCTGDASGVSGTATVVGLDLGSGPINGTPAVNSTLSVPGIADVILNEQITSTVAGVRKISVNALHLRLLSALAVVGTGGDIIIGHSECSTTAPATPAVTSLSPAQGPEGGGTGVVITGTNFLGLTGAGAVKFGTTNAAGYVVNSLTKITAVAPAGSPGPVDVRVANAAGTSANTTADNYTYLPTPTITNLTPAAGPTAGGSTVVITGTNFAGAGAVTFGGTNAASYTYNSPTQITAVTPPGAAGTVDVRVSADGGISATAGPANDFLYTAAPTVTGLSPPSGPLAAGTSVVVTGANLGGATAVRFGATGAVSYVVNSATQITATAPAGSAATVDVTVTTAGGTSSTGGTGNDYTYAGLPTVTGLSPATGPASGGTSIVVTGTNLGAASAVTFGGTSATSYTVNSATRITTTAPAGSPGTVDVVVTTPGGTSSTSSADEFAYVATPAVTGLSPASGPVPGGGTVVVTGTDLNAATSVRFGSTSAPFTQNSATQLTATAPAGSAGAVDVTVTTAGGTSSGAGSGNDYTYVATPAVTGLSPAAGPASGGTTVVLTGTDLTGATAVRFGPTLATSIVVSSATQITVTSPAGAVGVADVTVTTPGGTSPTTGTANDYTYVAAPTVTGLSPASGPTAGGDVLHTVVITGTGFDAVLANTVKFGSSTAAVVSVLGPTQLTVIAPAHAAGALDVTVTTMNGGTSATGSPSRYTYVGPPSVSALGPAAGPLGGGTTVVITGTGFTGAGAVSFGGAPASYTVDSDTQITATSPSNVLTGAVDVVVTTAYGTSATVAADRFTYLGAPSVLGLSPAAGPVAGGTAVTVTGSGFTGATAVRFGALPATGVTVTNDSTLVATAPAQSGAGPLDVTVTGPGGTSALTGADTFTYLAAPAVTAVSPAGGPVTAGTTVVLTGTDLTGASAVTFGSANAVSFTVDSATQITAVAPAHAVGAVHVRVSVPVAGTSAATAADQYTYVGPPVLTGISPTSGPVAGGTSVVITGAGFTGTSGVSFGAQPATGYTIDNDGRITTTAPAGSAGTVDVVVTTGFGSTSSAGSADDFSYVAPPVVVSISPATGSSSGGTTVNVTGTGFTTATAVRFGAVAATGIVVSSDTALTVTAPAQAGASVDVTVVGPGGTSTPTPADRFTYVDAPTVTALAPADGPVAGGTTVIVTGTGFGLGTSNAATAVRFGATAASFTIDSATRITAVAPAHAAGPLTVTVTTPDGGDSASAPANVYTYVALPTVGGLSPGTGPAAGGTSVVITGTGFTGASAVDFGPLAATSFTVDSPTRITALSPAHAAATVDVRVTTPYGLSPNSVQDDYRFVDRPAISAISPDHGPAVGGTQVTVTGTGFTNLSTVNFGATAAVAVQFASATELVATAPAGAGVQHLTVTDTGGTSVTSGADAFSYIPVPVVSSLTPDDGPSAGGTTVIVTGSGFSTAATSGALRFGSTVAAVYTVDSDTRITVTSPGHSSGTVTVSVTTPSGGTSAAGTGSDYSYVGAPAVTAISPDHGAQAGNTTVVVTGAGFATATGPGAVKFGTTDAAGYTVDSPTRITALSPPGTGTRDIRVSTVGGTSAVVPADAYTFVASPAVAAISPAAGPLAGGTVVTISGTSFVDVQAVTFGGHAATAYSVLDPTTITATSPAGTAGTVDLQVTTVLGASANTGADNFSYVAGPAVLGLVPDGGPLTGGTAVTITGSGFTGTTGVRFGAAVATNFTVLTDTTITVTSPAGTAGVEDVTVTTPFGSSDPSGAADDFTYAGPPSVTGLSPPSGPAAGGTVVTVTGTGFGAGATVDFGGGPGTSVQILTSTSLTVRSPPGPAGITDVVVSTIFGSSDPAGPDNDFSYLDAPVLNVVSPSSGTPAGGESVVLTGTGFASPGPVTQVYFGTASATFTVNSDSQVTATSPGGTGSVHITMLGPGGTSAVSAADLFTFLTPGSPPAVEPPTISAVAPDVGPTAGGTRLSISGARFDGSTTVTFGGAAGTSLVLGPETGFSLDSRAGRGVRAAGSNTLSVTTPAHAPGPVTVTVTNAGGARSYPRFFTFVPALSTATITVRVNTGSTTRIGPTGADYAGLQVADCSTVSGAGSVKPSSDQLACAYTAPERPGSDGFTMSVTDVLGQAADQPVEVTVVAPDDGGGTGTGGGGGNDGGGNDGGGSGSGGGGGNDTDGGGGGGGGGEGGSGGGGGNDTDGGSGLAFTGTPFALIAGLVGGLTLTLTGAGVVLRERRRRDAG